MASGRLKGIKTIGVLSRSTIMELLPFLFFSSLYRNNTKKKKDWSNRIRLQGMLFISYSKLFLTIKYGNKCVHRKSQFHFQFYSDNFHVYIVCGKPTKFSEINCWPKFTTLHVHVACLLKIFPSLLYYIFFPKKKMSCKFRVRLISGCGLSMGKYGNFSSLHCSFNIIVN